MEWIDSKENLGFGKGCNLAEKHATKPYLFFINPDTIISKNAFREMLHSAFSALDERRLDLREKSAEKNASDEKQA